MAGLFLLRIHVITGAYPPLVMGSVDLVLGPGIVFMLFLTLSIDLSLIVYILSLLI